MSQYHFRQQTPGPPQPQWQTPARKGWADPRLSPLLSSPASAQPTTLPLQPFPPPPPGPPPKAQPGQPWNHHPAQDTSSWGVKHHQQYQYLQDSSAQPPLPARPPSTYDTQSSWTTAQFPSETPPIPPPRPPQYAIPQPSQQQPSYTEPVGQNPFYPHEYYTQQTPSHRYEPPQNSWMGGQQYPQPYAVNNTQPWQPPVSQDQYSAVSPLESQQYTWQNYSVPAPTVSASHQLPQGLASQPTLSRPYQQEPILPDGQRPAGDQFAGRDSYPQDRVTVPRKHITLTATPEQLHILPANEQQPESSSDAASSDGPQRTNTIDMVMKAWSGPIDTSVQPRQSSERVATTLPIPTPIVRDTKSSEAQTDFPPITKTDTRIEVKEVDPYGDLKDEYRTSLNRYATMLRQERDAANNDQKSKIVFDFVNREVRLRSVLFNVDPAELVASAELMELRQNSDQLKRLQVEIAELKNELEQARQTQLVASPSISAPISSSITSEQQPRTTGEVQNTPGHAIVAPNVQSSSNKSVPSVMTGLVQVDSNTRAASSKNPPSAGVDITDEDDQYSPGGRPRYIRPVKQQSMSSAIPSKKPTQTTGLPGGVERPASPSDNAPMLLEDYTTPDRLNLPGRALSPSPGRGSPPLSPVHASASKSSGPLQFQPSRPAYMPFKYGEAAPEPAPRLDGSQRADEAYTKLRQEQAADPDRLLNLNSPQTPIMMVPDRAQTTTPTRAKQQQEEAFIGLLRQQSRLQRRPGTAPLSSDSGVLIPQRTASPLEKRTTIPPMVKAAQDLRAIVPSSLSQLAPTPSIHSKLAPIASELAEITDDFGFIKATVVIWDKDNRVVRHRLESDRSERESENQDRVDELFRENRIGYADIAGLEEEFKLAEATRKYQEDQQELESFTRGVFDVVTSRLGSEVSVLEKLRLTALEVLDARTLSASGRLRTAVSTPVVALERALLSETMALVLEIYNKIEVRQTKLAEAYFERERRRKRIELNILYVNGDTAGVKQLESEFAKAQFLQVLAEARKRDERANALMDSIDRAAVRGLAENQDWIDEVSNKVTLLRDLLHGAHGDSLAVRSREELLYGPGGIRETVDLLAQAVNIVLTDSRELVKMSSQADRLLNEADFAMFVAEAKIAEADQAEIDKLKAEKAKEDSKLEADFNGRINGVTRVPDEILATVKDIKDFVGSDSEHSVRISSALEAAKQRNGARSSIPI